MDKFQRLLVTFSWLIPFIIFCVIWDTLWKLIGLWKAGRNNDLIWFICIGIFNTMGILPIIYLLMDKKKRENISSGSWLQSWSKYTSKTHFRYLKFILIDQYELQNHFSTFSFWTGNGYCNSFLDSFQCWAYILVGNLYNLCLFHCIKNFR